MPSPARLLLAGLLGLCAALGLACGGSSNSGALIPREDARRLDAGLARIAQAVQDGNCPAALAGLRNAGDANAELPPSVDRELRARLREGLDNLARSVPEQCRAAETVPTETVPPETVPTETIPTETIPTETIPTETTPTETVPAPPPATSVSVPPATQPPSGGTDAPEVGTP